MHSTKGIKSASCYSIYGISLSVYLFYSPFPFISNVLLSIPYVMQSFWRRDASRGNLWHVHIASTTMDMLPREHCSSRHKNFQCKVCELSSFKQSESNLTTAGRRNASLNFLQHAWGTSMQSACPLLSCCHSKLQIVLLRLSDYVCIQEQTNCCNELPTLYRDVQNSTNSFTETVVIFLFSQDKTGKDVQEYVTLI